MAPTSVAATDAATSRTRSMKLLVNTKTQRVLFAEADKDAVDFLFSLLALPVATAAKLIRQESSVGVGNLYASAKKLDSAYILPGAAKDVILRPTTASASVIASRSLLGLLEPPPSSSVQPNRLCYSATKCPLCSMQMTTAMIYTGQYMVMDDLAVEPMSTISSITLLKTFGVRDLGDLEEETVKLGHKEALETLKTSLNSKSVLTDVFLANKASGDACVVDAYETWNARVFPFIFMAETQGSTFMMQFSRRHHVGGMWILGISRSLDMEEGKVPEESLLSLE